MGEILKNVNKTRFPEFFKGIRIWIIESNMFSKEPFFPFFRCKNIARNVKKAVISSKSRFLRACRGLLRILHSLGVPLLYLASLFSLYKSLRARIAEARESRLRRARHSSFGVYRPKNFLSSELKSSMK